MFAKFHGRDFIVCNIRTRTSEFLLEQEAFFNDLLYEQYDDYAILYREGLDAKACVIEYVDHSIESCIPEKLYLWPS